MENVAGRCPIFSPSTSNGVGDALLKVKPPCVSNIQVFDVYRGATLPKGKKSLAFLVLMQDTQRTLTDAEVDAAMEQLFNTLRDKFNGTTR